MPRCLPQRLVDRSRRAARPRAPARSAGRTRSAACLAATSPASATPPTALLRRLGVDDPDAAAFMRTDPIARKLLEGRAGKMVQARADARGALDELVARYRRRRAGGHPFHAARHRTRRRWPLERQRSRPRRSKPQVRLGSGTIRTSLFAATDEARIPDGVATQMAEMFAGRHRLPPRAAPRRHLRVVYEALTADGEPITWNPAAGRVLAAEFVNNGRSLLGGLVPRRQRQGRLLRLRRPEQARHVPRQPDGVLARDLGLRDALHPMQQTWRRHLGVDYAAPTGTPVRSGRRRRGRVRRLAERLRQRGARSSTATSARPPTRT